MTDWKESENFLSGLSTNAASFSKKQTPEKPKNDHRSTLQEVSRKNSNNQLALDFLKNLGNYSNENNASAGDSPVKKKEIFKRTEYFSRSCQANSG